MSEILFPGRIRAMLRSSLRGIRCIALRSREDSPTPKWPFEGVSTFNSLPGKELRSGTAIEITAECAGDENGIKGEKGGTDEIANVGQNCKDECPGCHPFLRGGTRSGQTGARDRATGGSAEDDKERDVLQERADRFLALQQRQRLLLRRPVSDTRILQQQCLVAAAGRSRPQPPRRQLIRVPPTRTPTCWGSWSKEIKKARVIAGLSISNFEIRISNFLWH